MTVLFLLLNHMISLKVSCDSQVSGGATPRLSLSDTCENHRKESGVEMAMSLDG